MAVRDADFDFDRRMLPQEVLEQLRQQIAPQHFTGAESNLSRQALVATEHVAGLARESPRKDVRLVVVGEIAEQAPHELAAGLTLLDEPTLRTTDAEEVADLVAYLLSPLADYITGTTVTIDGALSLTVAQGA